METEVRTPYQGITNIVRFNWHYYVIAGVLVVLLGTIAGLLPAFYTVLICCFLGLVMMGVGVSLAVSYYIYDYSDLYTLPWLNRLGIKADSILVNINAGFDETSAIIAARFPHNTLKVFDFYNPAMHTEVSIERARKAYPAYKGTETVSTNNPLPNLTADYVFLIMAAHEIRDNAERIAFFKAIYNKLNTGGIVVVVEHQRDLPNFLAFNFGFFHFYSPANWRNTFAQAGFVIESEAKQTAFVSTFILSKHGNPS